MTKEETLKFEGEVTDKLPNAMFKIKLDNGHELLCKISGKMRKNNINVYVHDKVEVEVTPYDLSKGRIIYRFK